MPFALSAVLLLVPLLELYVIVWVGRHIGAWPTLGLLLVLSLLGAYLLKREGTKSWRALRSTMQAGKVPGREIADAALVFVGGSLMVVPGFLTDVLGLLCILPFTRPLVRWLIYLIAGRKARWTMTAGKVAGGAGRSIANERSRRRADSAGAQSATRQPAESGIVTGEVIDRHDEA